MRDMGKYAAVGSLLFSFFLPTNHLFAENTPSFRKIGDYILYANSNPTFPDSSKSEPGWPIISEWGQEVYVTDTTLGQYFNPRIVAAHSLLHVFSERHSTGRLAPHHYVSTNGGNSWQFLADYDDTSFNARPGIINVFCDDNRIYTTWTGRRAGEWGFVYFRASNDYGQSWPITAELRFWWPFADTRYGNISGHGDTVFVSFEQDDSITCWRSTDMGVQWTDPGYIADGDLGYPPSIAYNAGVVHIVFNQDYGYVSDVYHISSFDHGETWTEPVLIGMADDKAGQWPEVAADSFGNVAVCWMDYLGSPYSWTGGIWCRVSHDSGQSWKEPVRLDSDYYGWTGTTVVIDGDYVGVAWKSSNPDGTNGLHYRESWDGGETWGQDQILSEGACSVPRLAKLGHTIHLSWVKTEEIGPSRYWDFIKYIRNDDVTGVESWNDPQSELVWPKLVSYPNPFNSVVVLTLRTFEGRETPIRIYDLSGRLVKAITPSNAHGKIQVTWDATDALGNKVSSGIYFAKVEVAKTLRVAKLLYLK